MKAEYQKLQAGHMLTLALLEADIENNNIQVSINSLDSIQQKFAPPIQQRLISLEQKKSNMLARKLEKKYASQKEISETEIRGMNSRIKRQENRIDRMQDDLNQLILIAPLDGFIIRTTAPEIQLMSNQGSMTMGGNIKEGSTLFPGMKVLEMPDMNQMQVLTELSESEYKRVEPGQMVKIRVDAKNKLYTTGTVKRKLFAGKKVNYNSEVKMYEAIIEVDSCHLQMTPGLSAICEVFIKEVKDTIVIPAIAVFEEDADKYVYVSTVETRCGVSLKRGVSLRRTEKYMKVKVETGPTNSSHVIICKGLDGNETISLKKPSANKILKTNSNKADTLENSMDSVINTIHQDTIPYIEDSLKIY
jgi:multidrug efflux pump subunit AcrA (membrane-fusion protein)